MKSLIQRPRLSQPVRLVSSAIAAVLAIFTIAFSVAAQEASGDRGRETGLDSAGRPQVWFAPNDNLPRPRGPDGYLNHDFPHLFDSKPAWDAKIDVFKISPKMGSTIGPADQLTRINAFLKDRHIALAASVGTILMDNTNPVPGECGYGVEGYNRPGRNAIQFKRLKDLGIEVRYVAMDEPLTFGHYYNKKNACRFSIDEVARRVAVSIAEIRQYYPDVQVVDEEAPQSMPPAQWNADFPKWLQAYRRATGQPFDAIMYDLNWSQPWQQVVGPGERVARGAGVRVGIFFTGAGPGSSDAEAVAAYKRNIQSVEASGLKFDLVDIANWTPHPSRNLPQSAPDTMTAVLAWYLQQHDASGRETRLDGAGRPQVWFNLTNYTMGQGVDGPEGWRVLGDPNARWPDFMSRIQVLATAGIWQTPDDVLGKTFAKFKDKHVAFAMESLAQSWVHEPPCGHGVESYYDPPGAKKTAEKIRGADGWLDVVAMDEPLWWGRYYSGSNACHSEIDNVAERAAAIMHEYQAAFPDVEIGDIEPIPALTNQPNWRAEYAAWMDAFYAKTGKRIAFLQIDINWRQPNWQGGLRDAVSFARARHLPVGIIYNANMTPAVTSDQLWLGSAKQNIIEIEDRLHIIPDQAIFHSWDKFPRRSITDQAGSGEDRLVEFYLERLENKGRER